jgi:dTDP-4-dehydrorhamnose reductase
MPDDDDPATIERTGTPTSAETLFLGYIPCERPEQASQASPIAHVSSDAPPFLIFHGDADIRVGVNQSRRLHAALQAVGANSTLHILPDASHVVRTAWVYGATGGNFVKTMARLEKERETVSVVDDQRGSPTWSRDLAAGLLALAGADVAPGVLHATNRGETTWFGFTKAIFEELGADPERVLPTTTDAFPRPAPRPANSVLSPRSWDDAGLPPLPDWRAALHEAFATVGDAFRG